MVGKANQHWNTFGISLDILRNDTPILETHWYLNQLIPVKYQQNTKAS